MEQTLATTETAVEAESSTYSHSEIYALLKGLSVAEKTKLARLAQAYAWKVSEWSTDTDLLQEAFLRVLNGNRKWPRNLGPTPFFCMVMQSIAWEWRKSNESIQMHDLHAGVDHSDPADRIDEGRIFEMLETSLAGDPAAQQIVKDMRFGFTGVEAKKRSTLNDTSYASKMTKIRRCCEKLRRSLRVE